MSLPSITSLGLPPEKHADRVVTEMMKVIARDRVACWARIRDAIRATNDGNPKAQNKLLKRIREKAGSFLLGSSMETGKRGRYTMHMIDLDCWDFTKKDFVGPDDPIPENSWISLNSTRLVAKGDHRYDETTILVLMFTHHALSRLCQRCGARSLDEVYASVKAIAVEYLVEVVKKKQRLERLRVELPNELGAAICTIVNQDGIDYLVTIWNEVEEFADERRVGVVRPQIAGRNGEVL